MRAIAIAVLAVAACGGSSKKPTTAPRAEERADTKQVLLAQITPIVARTPVSGGDTLLDEYRATHGERHPVPAMRGEVHCYGGGALDGTIPVEMYVRRAIDPATTEIVEDSVRILPDDLVPQRRHVAMRSFAGVGPLRAVKGAAIEGRALVELDGGKKTVQIFRDGDGALVVLGQEVRDDSLEVMSLRISPEQAGRYGLDVGALDDEDSRALFHAALSELARTGDVLTVRGELPAIDAAQCGEIFASLPPVAD